MALSHPIRGIVRPVRLSEQLPGAFHPDFCMNALFVARSEHPLIHIIVETSASACESRTPVAGHGRASYSESQCSLVLHALAYSDNMPSMSVASLGSHLRELREQRGISLRKFAERLGISAAHLVDLEKDRRSPSPELIQKIADELDIPVTIFDHFSLALPKTVRDWVDQNPILGRALNLFTKLDHPQEALSMLERAASPDPPHRFPMAIYESELQAIGQESASWDFETGGDLFGIWGEIPIVYLATKSGPNSVRDHAHFRLDVDYLIKLSIQLEKDWGLRYFGDWHSHHRLGLLTPSGGDKARIQRLAEKNEFREMAEFIITFSPSYSADQAIHVHPYAYLHLPSDRITDIVPIVLSGTSPVRDVLMREGLLPDQQLDTYTSFSLDRVVVPREPLPRVPGHIGPVAKPITDRVIQRSVGALEVASSSSVEIHETAFGFVLVAHVTDSHYVAIAVDGTWPHAVLRVDWMNRSAGTSEELPIDVASASALNSSQLTTIFQDAKRSKRDSFEQ